MNILERLKLEDDAQKSMQGTNTRLAEVIRMYETLLGRDGFRKGMDLCLGYVCLTFEGYILDPKP